jgi:hypothetical protein
VTDFSRCRFFSSASEDASLCQFIASPCACRSALDATSIARILACYSPMGATRMGSCVVGQADEVSRCCTIIGSRSPPGFSSASLHVRVHLYRHSSLHCDRGQKRPVRRQGRRTLSSWVWSPLRSRIVFYLVCFCRGSRAAAPLRRTVRPGLP